VKLTVLRLFVLLIAVAFELNGCGGGAADQPAPTPVSELDALINQYDKLSGECLRLSKKHSNGDLSVTVRLIGAQEGFQDTAAKLKQASGKLTPSQKQRVAEIAAEGAPCLGP